MESSIVWVARILTDAVMETSAYHQEEITALRFVQQIVVQRKCTVPAQITVIVQARIRVCQKPLQLLSNMNVQIFAQSLVNQMSILVHKVMVTGVQWPHYVFQCKLWISMEKRGVLIAVHRNVDTMRLIARDYWALMVAGPLIFATRDNSEKTTGYAQDTAPLVAQVA